jgi:predicted P-loop ATPase
LASLNRKQITSVKSFISRQYVKVRPPFGDKTIRAARRTSFVGSTNQTNFLNDPTGSVRWICHLIKKIDWNYKKDFNIDEIWSQAYYLYLSGYKYELTSEEINQNEVSNEEFQLETAEMEIIRKHFYEGTKENRDFILTPTEIERIIKIHYNSTAKVSLNGIGRALSSLHFKRESHYRLENGHSLKGYCIKLRDKDKLAGIKLLLN